MPSEMLTYLDLANRLKTSPEAARALARRLRLPRTRGNDGKTLVSVDLSEIQHTPLPARSPAGHQAVAAAIKAKVATLEAERARLETTAAGHRADFERERERVEWLMVEILKVTVDAILRSRSWWRRLAG
jgi:hypothetical protein